MSDRTRTESSLESPSVDAESNDVGGATSIKQTLARAERLNGILRAVRNVNQLITKEDDPQRLIEGTCANLTETLSYHNAWIALLDEAGSVIATAQSGLDGDFDPLRERLLSGEFSECMRRALDVDGVVTITDPVSECQSCPLAKAYRGRVGLTKRLAFRGKTYGVLAASVPKAYADDAEEQSLLDEVAGDLAFALHKIDMAERKKESDQCFQQIYDHMAIGVARVSLDFRIEYANRAYCGMLGMCEEELVGKTLEDITMPEVLDENLRKQRSLANGEIDSYRMEKIFRHRDGHAVYGILDANAIRDAKGNPRFFLGTVVDITERKRVEEALQRKEHDLSESQRIAHVGSWRLDLATHQVVWTEELYKMYGFDSSLPPPPYTEHQKLFTPESWERLSTALAHTRDTGIPYTLELETVRKDGSNGWMWVHGEAEIDSAGKTVGLWGAAQDITEGINRAARMALLVRMLDDAPAAITIHDTNGRFLFSNRHNVLLHGYDSEEEILAVNLHQLDLPESEVLLAERFQHIAEHGEAHFEVEHYRKDGSIFPLEVTAKVIDWQGQPAVLSIAVDISDRKQSEEVLAFLAQSSSHPASDDFFQLLARLISEKLDMGFVCIDRLDGDNLTAHTVAVYSNGKFEDNVSYALKDTPCGEVVGKHVCCFPASIKTLFPNDAVLQQMEAESYVGVTLWGHDGRPIGLIAVIGARSLTNRAKAESLLRLVAVRAAGELERRQAEEMLRESEKRFHSLFERAPLGYQSLDSDGRFIEVNQAWLETLGYTREEVIGKWFGDFLAPEYKQAFIERFSVFKDEGKVHSEFYMLHKDGTRRYISFDGRIGYKVDGSFKQTHCILKDDTERKQTETKLAASEGILRDIMESTLSGFWDWNLVRKTEYLSPTFKRMFGYEDHEMENSPEAWQRIIFSEDLPSVLLAFDRHVKSHGREPFYSEIRYHHKNGSTVWVICAGRVIEWAEDGTPLRMVGCHVNITARKHAEAEREKLQAQLNHAQKMESVGRLAGGVAHDFNNMIMGIQGYVELCQETIGGDHPAREWLGEIMHEAQRSTTLIRQLLAFARKQTANPQVLNLNDVVADMLKMLGRLIGEDIELSWQPSAEAGAVKIDPGQVDQILANLCVNARDAINGVGKVTLTTQNVFIDAGHCAKHAEATPGSYVMLAVGDSGCGMNRETLDKIFEPFFTTKGVGKGTGLGLATVYGIVRQNGGFVHVESELGKGSTFTIYLPRHQTEAVSKPEKEPERPRVRGHETILLVEDEPAILKMTAIRLQRDGYTVLAAGTPTEAIRLATEHRGGVHLILSDVVMPEMNGRDLVNHILTLHPTVKSLFMSGYTADVIAHNGVLDEDVNFIQKPFSTDDLLVKVREVLDQE